MKTTGLFIFLLFLPQAFALDSRSCAPCHPEIYRRYLATPMARTSGPVSAVSASIPDGQVSAGAAQYSIHKFTLDFRQGDITGQRRLDYFLGSGLVGRSFVSSLNGFLFQAPVSYYTAPARWGLSPGYEQSDEMLLTREVEPACLRCHASGVRTVPGTLNGYELPPFTEAGVSCERCHGAGEKHIARMSSGNRFTDKAIVNPAKLDATRRDSVCAQCHLPGAVTVARANATRPYQAGDRLADSVAVFVLEGIDREATVNGHFEQLSRSGCARASKGRLWCGTCHAAHSTVAAGEKAAFYRERCFTCHTIASCTAPRAERAKAQDNCIACHMPSRPAETVQHAALTNHAIPRRPNTGAAAPVPADAALLPFTGFAASERDLGLAYATLALRNNDRIWGMRAFELLRRVDSKDTRAAIQLAQLYDRIGREQEACLLYEKAAASEASTPATLVNYGICLAKQGDLPNAMRQWRTALTRSPTLEPARENLAVAQQRLENLAAARATIDEGLTLNPVSRRLQELRREMAAP